MEPTSYQSRLSRLQAKMQAQAIDGMLIAQNVDLYYLTGSMQTGFMFVPAEGEPRYYVRRSLSRAITESYMPVEELGSLRMFESKLAQTFTEIFREGARPVIAAEFDVLPVQWYHRLQAALPRVEWVDGSTLIRETRMIKTNDEIAQIKQAAAVIDHAFEEGLDALQEGMKEIELMSLIEKAIRLQGHLGMMRTRGFNQEIITGVVGAGEAIAQPTYFDGPTGGLGMSAASPQSSSVRRIRRNEPILIDIGCCINGYVIDQTRTVVIGELPDDLYAAYLLAEEVLRSTETRLQPGAVCQELYAASLEQVDPSGLREHFMGYGAEQVKFIGHGIGLEMDEYPVLAKGFQYPLEPGMVLAIEPKFTFPGQGVVGIENSYVITSAGYEQLTVSREGLITL
ncbi:Xaa-Pro peptidase family protein [Paenibacillus sp. J2TS4]|uniref:M24 family metallopeptidase n=1 Tax=Paenibacillus sp. J2TS4 TaxID=2807194 RepID=UPI001B291F27|nr:Xaa-Pro peptidase family protein [Paenibacillus sp. J2TS4]GIP34323.1 peptidase M24 [Paenibacillus sp. J2TS4]